MRIFVFLVFFFSSFFLFSQNNTIEILQADSLIGKNTKDENVKQLIGNVHLRQKKTHIWATTALLNTITNSFEAFGAVKITPSDSITITGDSAVYEGNTRMAFMRGHAVFTDKENTLSSPELEYDLTEKKATYHQKGIIINKDTRLTSEEGIYFSQSKVAQFRKKVTIINKKYLLKSDSLDYHTHTKIAYFTSPAVIISSKKDTLYAQSGQYNTENGNAFFTNRSKGRYQNYTIQADTLHFFGPEKNRLGIAKGKVVMHSLTDKITITGKESYYFEKLGLSKIMGRPLLKYYGSKDTLYVRADTLISIENQETKKKKVQALKNVLLVGKELQAKCDSLLYTEQDSSFSFHKNPILWNETGQMKSDTIRAFLAFQQLKQLFLRGNGFMIMQDSLAQFNQVKGKEIEMNFVSIKNQNEKKTELRHISVIGNGESIYYVIEKNTTSGLNNVTCGRMDIWFQSQNKLDKISFFVHPEGKFIPPFEFNENNVRLENFDWKPSEKPTIRDILK